jgi:hypothetical protein
MEDFRICRECGYTRGFHVYFKPDGEQHRIGLICPSCGRSFDVGWVTPRLEGPAKAGAQF